VRFTVDDTAYRTSVVAPRERAGANDLDAAWPRVRRCPPRKRSDEFVACHSAIVGRYAVVLVTMLQRHGKAERTEALTLAQYHSVRCRVGE
jgi:hypothetical protein